MGDLATCVLILVLLYVVLLLVFANVCYERNRLQVKLQDARKDVRETLDAWRQHKCLAGDEAFAEIAGISPDEWRRRVEAYRMSRRMENR